jgi:hypothetical protein
MILKQVPKSQQTNYFFAQIKPEMHPWKCFNDCPRLYYSPTSCAPPKHSIGGDSDVFPAWFIAVDLWNHEIMARRPLTDYADCMGICSRRPRLFIIANVMKTSQSRSIERWQLRPGLISHSGPVCVWVPLVIRESLDTIVSVLYMAG